jgi:hypothetical protein
VVKLNNTLKSGDDDHDIDLSEVTTSLASAVNDVPTTDVDVYEDMLHFENFSVFADVMASLVTKEHTIIDDWHSSFSNFNSLRGFYTDQLADEDVDDIELDETRLYDPYFEGVLNEDLELRIQDTVYKYYTAFFNLV